MRAGRRGNDPRNHEQVGRIHCYLPTHPPTRHDEGRNQSPPAHLVHPVRSAVTRAQVTQHAAGCCSSAAAATQRQLAVEVRTAVQQSAGQGIRT